jgi:hypothetical protein
MDVRRAVDLLAEGSTERDIARQFRAGELVRVRHGAYASELADGAVRRHLQLLDGTWRLLGDGAVVSHGTAAALWGLPTWDRLLDTVSITRTTGGHGRIGRHLHAWMAPLEDAEVLDLDGFRVTSLERTAVDVARQVSYERAVAVLDAALHLGADKAVVGQVIDATPRRRGTPRARRALAFADGRSESVAESISRVRMAQVGLPAPELQFRVFDSFGRFVARTDFAWPDYELVGEFDGKVKYVGESEEVTRAVLSEKRRHESIGDQGWWIVRWGWQLLADPVAFERRIRGAMTRSVR